MPPHGDKNPKSKTRAAVWASSDFAKAADILSKIGQNRFFDSYQAKARAFVDENWSAISMVARELLDEKQLSDTEVALIIDVADGKKDALQSLARHRERLVKRS